MTEKFPDGLSGYFQDRDGDQKLTIYGNKDQIAKLDSGTLHILPIAADGPLFKKRLVEASLNLLGDVTTQALHKDGYKNEGELNKSGISDQYTDLLHDLGMFAGYLVNTTSWEVQELQSYDKRELKNRLEKVIKHLS